MATKTTLSETNKTLTTTSEKKPKLSKKRNKHNNVRRKFSWRSSKRSATVNVTSDRLDDTPVTNLDPSLSNETRLNLFPTDQNLIINNDSTQEQQNGATISTTQKTIWLQLKRLHFKNLGHIDKDLIFFRALSITGLICYTIIDTMMYSSASVDKSEVLQFLHGSRYIPLEIFTTIYASGVVAFGVSIEIYILVPYAIVTCVLVARKCNSYRTTTTGIFWIVKILFVFIAVEINHWNFRQYHDYMQKFRRSSRALQRQALIFSVSMLFLSATSLTAIYGGVHKSLPLYCPYDTSHCGIVELYEPLFSYDNEKCLNELRNYITAREQLRVIRNFMFLNGVSYAVFNCNTLDIDHRSKYFYIRSFLVLLYIGLATSVLVAYVDPLYFIQNCYLAYNIVEIIIFIILFFLPGMNLYRLWRKKQLPISNIYRIALEAGRQHQQNIFHNGVDMDEHPDILPRP